MNGSDGRMGPRGGLDGQLEVHGIGCKGAIGTIGPIAGMGRGWIGRAGPPLPLAPPPAATAAADALSVLAASCVAITRRTIEMAAAQRLHIMCRDTDPVAVRRTARRLQ